MAAVESTIRQEIEVGRRHTPGFGGRTLLLEVWVMALMIASSWAALAGAIPLWLGSVGNTIAIYATYTVVHEAVHGNISSRHRSLRWIDTLAGIIACVPLWLHYHQHRRQHMAHHAHTNEDTDPDIYARGGFPGWLFLRLPVALASYFDPVRQYRDCRRFGLPRREIAYTAISFTASVAVVLGLAAAGYGRELLILWFIPWWIGQSVMLTFFTWLPHFDHFETGRYRNTRITEFPGANFLLQGQNYHLIHHMMPAIPYYRYAATYRDLRPLLQGKGVRIGGVIPDLAAEDRRAGL